MVQAVGQAIVPETMWDRMVYFLDDPPNRTTVSLPMFLDGIPENYSHRKRSSKARTHMRQFQYTRADRVALLRRDRGQLQPHDEEYSS